MPLLGSLWLQMKNCNIAFAHRQKFTYYQIDDNCQIKSLSQVYSNFHHHSQPYQHHKNLHQKLSSSKCGKLKFPNFQSPKEP